MQTKPESNHMTIARNNTQIIWDLLLFGSFFIVMGFVIFFNSQDIVICNNPTCNMITCEQAELLFKA